MTTPRIIDGINKLDDFFPLLGSVLLGLHSWISSVADLALECSAKIDHDRTQVSNLRRSLEFVENHQDHGTKIRAQALCQVEDSRVAIETLEGRLDTLIDSDLDVLEDRIRANEARHDNAYSTWASTQRDVNETAKRTRGVETSLDDLYDQFEELSYSSPTVGIVTRIDAMDSRLHRIEMILGGLTRILDESTL